jgi:hypothetical protein
MNIVKQFGTMSAKLFSVLAIVLFSTTSIAATPFPGKLPATIVNIEAANIIHVNIETWPGFRRDFRVTLPNLVVPGQGEDVMECELVLAQLAHDFAVNFLSDSTTVHVKDMQMDNSSSEDATSSIYTNKGSLDNALRRERLARPTDIATNEPWC